MAFLSQTGEMGAVENATQLSHLEQKPKMFLMKKATFSIFFSRFDSNCQAVAV